MSDQKQDTDSADLSKERCKSPTRDDVFDEVFGGPCWTESCPTPKECFQCIVCSPSDGSQVRPPSSSYFHTHTETVENENESPPPPLSLVPEIRVVSPRPSLPTRRLSPRLTPVSSPVLPAPLSIDSRSTSGELVLTPSRSSINVSWYPSDSLNRLQVPDTSSVGSITDSRQNLSLDFKPATVTPTNLSPVPRSPEVIVSTFEFTNPVYDSNDYSSSAENIPMEELSETSLDINNVLASINALEDELKLMRDDLDYSLPPTPPPPVQYIDRLVNSEEFVRPKIAALESHCTCRSEHPFLGGEKEPIPWVHTRSCKIVRDLYEVSTAFINDSPIKTSRGAEGAAEPVPRCSPGWCVADQAMTARICLRVHSQPSRTLLAHLFSQYKGYRGICATPDEDFVFVAYATDEQSLRAKLGLEDLLFSQPQRIHVTVVDMEQALRQIHGIKSRFRFPSLCCQKKH